MSYSVRSIDLDFSKGIFHTSGWMTLEWQDPRYQDPRQNSRDLQNIEEKSGVVCILLVYCWSRYRWDPAEYDSLVSVPLPFSKSWAPEVSRGRRDIPLTIGGRRDITPLCGGRQDITPSSANRYTKLENLAWYHSVFIQFTLWIKHRFMKPLLLSSIKKYIIHLT